jgi:hypothetical protein
VDTAELLWRETPYPGVLWKKLYYDGTTGQSAVLLKFEPGETWGAGSYVHHPPGSVHRPSSREGCTLFVRLPRPIEITDGSDA